LFNPIVPIHLDRSTWAPIDMASAAALAIFGHLLEGEESELSLEHG
jgi:hypothetical protein